jgi:PPOX class probable F420-dependent enzyme
MNERLDDPRVQRFLATKDIVVLATIQPDGAPLATPVWFLHSPTTLTMISEAATQKIRNLRRDPRVSVAAEAGSLVGMGGVIVQGQAEFLPDSPERRALVSAFLRKYQPDLGRRWGGDEMPADRVMFHVVPRRVYSWGLPG